MKKTILILALTGIIALSAAPPKQSVIVTVPAKPREISITEHDHWRKARDFVYIKHQEGYQLKSFALRDGFYSLPNFIVVMEKY